VAAQQRNEFFTLGETAVIPMPPLLFRVSAKGLSETEVTEINAQFICQKKFVGGLLQGLYCDL